MRKLIVLEPEVYNQLKQNHVPAEKKIITDVDAKMSKILHSDLPEDEKLKLYNQELQRSRLFLKKTQTKPVVKEKRRPESEILKPFKKRTRVKKILESVKKEKNLDWDSVGRLVLDGRVVPGSDIGELLQSTVKKRKPNLAGLKEFEGFKWESL